MIDCIAQENPFPSITTGDARARCTFVSQVQIFEGALSRAHRRRDSSGTDGSESINDDAHAETDAQDGAETDADAEPERSLKPAQFHRLHRVLIREVHD